MGVMTLTDLEDEVNANLKYSVTNSTRLDRWINAAAEFVHNQFDFENNKKIHSFNTVVDQIIYNLPTDIEGIRALRNVTPENTGLLRRSERIWSFDATSTGMPTRWGQEGQTIYLWPTPDGVYNLELWYIIQMAKLSTKTSVTVFPDHWDMAVVFYATYIGSMSTQGAAAALPWYQAYSGYVSKIQDEYSLRADSDSEGLWVAHDESDLENLRG